jgi:thiamine pyrophosphate-dependent acetolactate synthase large subunit-like protein
MLDVPIELMMSPVDQEHISWGAIADPPTYPPGPNEDAIEALTQLWKSAKRPIIIAEVIGRSKARVRMEAAPVPF